MKSTIAGVFGLALISLSSSVFSAGSAFYGVTITGLNADSTANNTLFVKVNQPAGTGGCHTDANWNFAISLDPNTNPTGKYMFAILMTAQSNGTPVDIVGLSTCPAFSTIQGIARVASAN